MKRAVAINLVLAATSLMIPLACPASTQETFNQDDGEHEMFKARTSKYPFGRKMTFHSRWQACRWVVDVKDSNGKRRSLDHGGSLDSIFVPFVDGRRAWVTQTSCGPVVVHNR